MLQHVLHVYKLNLGFAKRLVNDLSADQMCQQPHGVVNHPAPSCCGDLAAIRQVYHMRRGAAVPAPARIMP